MIRRILVALAFLTACAHAPSPDSTYIVEVWRSEHLILCFRALGAYELTGGVSATFWYARSDVPVLKSGLVVAGLEFTGASRPGEAVIIPFALAGQPEDRLNRNALNRLKQEIFTLRPGEAVVVSHFEDGTELPFPLRLRVCRLGREP